MKRETKHRRLLGEVRVEPSMAGRRITEILRDEMKLPNRQIKKVIATRGVMLNGRPAHSEQVVKPGDQLRAFLPENEQVKVEAVSMELRVLFEDAWLLALDKPPGINVHNTRPGEPPALVNGVAHYFQARGERITPRPVHRLDREASGVVLFAKSAEAQTLLTQRWETEDTRKLYWVLAEGILNESQIIKTPILGKEAKTIIEPIASYGSVTELRAEIKTGRTHQIRVHLESIGHPVVGERDRFKGRTRRRLALHAETLELVHPITSEKLRFVSPAPREAFMGIINSNVNGGRIL